MFCLDFFTTPSSRGLCVVWKKFRLGLNRVKSSGIVKLDAISVRKIVRNVVHYGVSTKEMARKYGVSERRIQQLCKEYRETGNIPFPKKVGRKRKEYDEEIKRKILKTAKKYRCGAVKLSRILRKKYGIKLDHNKVQEILRVNGMAKEDEKKRKRKKPWVRYEREHSLSAVHMDWYYDSVINKWICAVMDDASRMILACGEYDSPTAEASIQLLDEAYEKYRHIAPIREVITDHGSQFYANKRNKKGKANHSFENYCKSKGIKHILCKYKHPQSNGKIEKWFHIYQKDRHSFPSLQHFIDWYNKVRPHMSLDMDNLETPEKAFYRKAQDIILGNFFRYIEKIEKEGGEELAK